MRSRIGYLLGTDVIATWVGRITMYRLVLYFLCLLLGSAAVLSWFGVLSYDGFSIVLQAFLFAAVSWGVNAVIARSLGAKPNIESSLITGLILASIMGPLSLPREWPVLLVAVIAAIGSKYLIAPHKSHVFNPAAFGAVASAILLDHPASWWIGSTAMMPLVLAGGLVVAWNIRRFHLIASFLLAYVALFSLDAAFETEQWLAVMSAFLKYVFTASPLLFFAFVMLVEPLTTPRVRSRRSAFGVAVGAFLFFLQRVAVGIPFSLELSLLIGNAIGRLVSPDFRQVFTLARKEHLTPAITNSWFAPARPFSFIPGQFLEYTLPHLRADSRGIRRYFTIASSPAEREILLTTKFSEPGSSFKRSLREMEVGGEITASKVAGDFILLRDPSAKIAFIAGGIGVTPFRSMVQHLLDTNQIRDIVLLYAARTEQDLVFRDLFEEASHRFGIRSVFVLSDTGGIPAGWTGRVGAVDAALIRDEVPDFGERTFFVSGPEPMVRAMASTLASMGVSQRHIRRDYFPGYE